MRLPAAIGGAVQKAVAPALCALLLGSGALAPQDALAKTDGAAIAGCLFRSCPLPLARCIADPTCLANVACIQTCTNRPDEAECQIECGDKFSNAVVGKFTECAVSGTAAQCVPQRQDDGSWPVPKEEALVKSFSAEALQGTWYISAGLNKAFDIFDCQKHVFEAPSPTRLVGNLQWRIKDPVAGTNFVTRYTVQEFVQDPLTPGIMYNHDNDFLHYQDDWYILGERPGEWVLIYYRGNNDAWDGYGGATVYSTNPVLDKKYFAEIDESLQKIGRRFSEFTLTDNTCKERETKLEEAYQDLVFVENRVATGLVTAESNIVATLKRDVQEIERELVVAERAIQKQVMKVEKEIEKDVVEIEREIEKDLTGLAGLFKR